MLIKCDILKYTLSFQVEQSELFVNCSMLWPSLAVLLHCHVPSSPLLGHSSSGNKYRGMISARNVPPKGACLVFVLCMCVLERTAYYNIRPLCFPSFNTHWFSKMSLANTTPCAFVPFTNISHLSPISYNCWVSCYGKQLFHSSRPNEHRLCGLDFRNIY